MTLVRRLRFASSLLAIVAAITCASVWGDSSGRNGKTDPLPLGNRQDANVSEAIAATRFTNTPLLTYRTQQGENLFALQITPKLAPLAARPRDIAILIDTSASQAGKPLVTAREITSAINSYASPDDTISIWAVNTPKTTRDLVVGFQKKNSDAIVRAIQHLESTEYASGAVDLGEALRKVIPTFDQRISRQQIILFLGDGESAFNPLLEKDRLLFAKDMVNNQISFFAVPIGPKIHSENLNTLVTSTGGAIVRLPMAESLEKRVPVFMQRLNAALNTPVVMPTAFTFAGKDVIEFLPTKLPPLRANQPTLVVGKFGDKMPKNFNATVSGTVLGNKVEFTVAEVVPESKAENFFLATVVSQWKKATMPEAPAFLRADRTLALAYEQCRLSRDELLSQAHWAVSNKQYDIAITLYTAVESIDPSESEAKLGLKFVDKLKSGKITPEQINKTPISTERLRIGRNSPEEQVNAVRVNLRELADDDAQPGGEALPAVQAQPQPGTPEAGQDLLRAEQARRTILEQQTKLLVEESLKRARQLLASDPDSATELLKQQLRAIRENPDLQDRLKQQLSGQMEVLLREVGTKGAYIKQTAAEERERIARARERLQSEDRRIALAERERERIRAFSTLMSQARYEEAYREALIMQQEAINLGFAVPVETTAAYIIGENATNLRELHELKRIREERFLLTLMQVEKSHVPYPDEPPVHFPPASVWRELYQARKGYAASGLGSSESPRTQELRRKLDEPFSNDKAIDGAPLESVLEFISLRANVTILIDEAAFKQEDPAKEVRQTPVKLPELRGVTLSTAMRLVLDEIGAVYQVRRDYIDIVPAGKAYTDKVLRVFPVADLVFPIPQSVNPQALQQNLQVQGASTAASILGFQGQIQGGFGGGFGGGGFGGGGFGGGGFGNQQGGGIQGGLNGGGQFGGANGQAFQGQGNVNQGFGGGAAGFGGGQLGQFGNAGGQFGLQGGTQQDILMELIRQVVEPGYWGTYTPGAINQGNADPLMAGGEEQQPVAPLEQLNTLGYFPPANSLVIRGASKRYSPLERPSRRPAGLPPGAGLPKRLAPGDAVVKKVDPKVDPKNDPNNPAVVAIEKRPDLATKDPKKVWANFLANGTADPRLVIDGAEVLMYAREFAQAAELLKSTLRQGVSTQTWVHESLALALQSSQGSPDDIERARVSALDLEPTSAQAYLSASKAMSEMKAPELALRFCRLAASFAPDMPESYANALVYAGESKVVDSDVTIWAASNLLRREWAEGTNYHAQAKDQLIKLERLLQGGDRAADVEKIRKSMDQQKVRDLVVELLFQGPADLDLIVKEPTGIECAGGRSRTPGGGLLRGDSLDQKDTGRSEIYVAAEAFTGTYQIRVDRIWGRPLGNKATIKITRHQGTSEQVSEIRTINLDQDNAITVHLDNGRRKEVAVIAPPAISNPGDEMTSQERARSQQVMNRLRAMSNPVMSQSPIAMTGGVGARGIQQPSSPYDQEAMIPMVGLTAQKRIISETDGGVEFAADVEVLNTKDGPAMRLKMNPVWSTVAKGEKPTVRLTLIPGANP